MTERSPWERKDVYIKYLDSPYHTDGDMIIGPCSHGFAERYKHVSANPVAIVGREQLTAEQLASAQPVPEVVQLVTCAGCGTQHPGQPCDLQDGLPLDDNPGTVNRASEGDTK